MGLLRKAFDAWVITRIGPGRILLVMAGLVLLAVLAVMVFFEAIKQLVVFGLCVAIVIFVLKALLPGCRR